MLRPELASSKLQPRGSGFMRDLALAQVVVPQCEAAACNLRTRCRLTNLNTPFESILRGDSSFGIRSRSFARAVSVFSIKRAISRAARAWLQKGLMAVQLKPALAALAWPRRWRLLCAHGRCPAPCPLLHRLGPCSRMCLARLGLCALSAGWAVSAELAVNAQRASSLQVI